MGKRIRRIAQASNIAKTLSFDIRPAIVMGLALHWSWIWLGFWSSAYYSVEPDFSDMAGGASSIEPLWVLSLLANSASLALLFAARRRLAPLGARAWAPATAAVLTAAGTLMMAQIVPLPANDAGLCLYIVGALLTGVGSAVSFALWGELLTVLGMRQTVVYGVSATLAGSFLYFIGLLADAQVVRIVVALFPLAGMALYWTQREQVGAPHAVATHAPALRGTSATRGASAPDSQASASHASNPHSPDAHVSAMHASDARTSAPRPSAPCASAAHSPSSRASAPQDGSRPMSHDGPEAKRGGRLSHDLAALVGISLFFGTSYGLMKGLFAVSGDEIATWRDALNIAAFIVGALAIFITMSMFKMDFGHLTYQVALPLMAVGFLFIPLLGHFQLAGFFLHQLGYQYFYVVLWALWPALAKENERTPAITFCCASMTGMQTGQLVGSIAGSSLIQRASDPYALAMMAAVAIFAILMVALFGFGNAVSQSRWWVDRPMETALPAKFRRTCAHIAAAYGLTERETEVFFLLAKGRNCAHISKQLVISEPTTKTHIKNVYRKLGIHSQQALLDMVELENR